ncbi:MAG: transposase, partial [Planctomycetes bacterium]|nr:transposase [Planctomycetota bacterium]
MNRGIARRAVFETRADVRAFLCLLAVAVRRRKIEVIAFCFMTTHFHLVLRSLDGHLSETLRWVLNVYVRWFNRRRRRDGKRPAMPIPRRVSVGIRRGGDVVYAPARWRASFQPRGVSSWTR